MLKTSVLELSNTPEHVLGAQKTITSPSGVSLQMQYLPMIQKRDVKTQVYGMGIRLINRLILKYLEVADPIFAEKFNSLKGNKYRNDVVFQDPLPQDDRRNLEIARERLALGLSTRRLELEELGYSQAEAEKIIEEAREDLEEDAECGVQFDYTRGKGQTPNRGGPDETRGEKIVNTLEDKSSGVED
jgi:hypothetical protein